MRFFHLFAFVAFLCIANALPEPDVKTEVPVLEDVTTPFLEETNEVESTTELDVKTVVESTADLDVELEDEMKEEEEEIKKEFEDGPFEFEEEKALNEKKGKEIIVSKDNLIPILKTIVLAFTHKRDPTYKEIFETGGKQLFKLAEKKVGNDKHMKGLLSIIKKYVEDFKLEGMTDEEEEVLTELAQQYLKTHKFQILFPESLLLHQPEMDLFVAKKRELGDLEGRQLKFDFEPYINRLQALTTNIRSRLQSMPIFNRFNLDRIGSTFGSVVDEYMPALRNGAGIMDLGVSMGSLTALAAAGALISAPFFLRSFSGRESEDEDNFYDNRRVGTGGYPAQQFIASNDKDSAGYVKRPEWMDNYEKQKERVYSPNVNPHYNEPSFALHAKEQNVQNHNAAKDDEAYNKYLNEYNQWLQQYHNALSTQQNPDKEYEEYYRKYREWYSQYYNEHFGEELPQYQPVAPNAYEENNNIKNMPPPPPVSQNPDTAEAVVYSNYQHRPSQPNTQGTNFYHGTSRNPQPAVQESENSNFQVIHVDENERNSVEPTVEMADQLPQASALISHQSHNPVYNQNVHYQYPPSPRPVYRNPESVGPATESGFKPLGSESQKVIMFKKKETPYQRQPEKPVAQPKENFNGFSSIKSISIFGAPDKEQEMKNVEVAPSKSIRVVQAHQISHPSTHLEQRLAIPSPRPTPSAVTSGIFRTSSKPTPRSATTPRSFYQEPKASVRVVTSKSVVTSAPVLKESKPAGNDFKKRKITLTDLLQNQKQAAAAAKREKEVQTPPAIESRRDDNIIDFEEQRIPIFESAPTAASDDLPVYALDPFYGPRLSRTDAIFHQLSLTDESCREQVVCNMYKNPNAYTPLSDFLSRQLTVTYEQLKRPTVNDDRVLRFFKYLQAARAGQDGFDCLERFPNCPSDTTRLSYKPIVNAYNKVSVLMNASGSL